MTHIPIPIACSIPRTEAGGRRAEWRDLVTQARSTKRIEGGVVLTMDPALADDVTALVEKEAECCAFLSMTTETSTDELLLSIMTEDEGALPTIEALLGLEPRK